MGKEYTRRVTSKDALPGGENVLLFDDCEGVSDWYDFSSTGGDDVIEFSTTIAFRGKQSLRLKTRVAGAAPEDIVRAARGVGLRESKRLKISSLIRFEDDMAHQMGGIAAQIANGTQNYQPELAIDFNPPGIFYLNSAGVWTSTELDFTATSWVWFRLEMVVNTVTGKYESVRMGDQELKLDVAMKEVAVTQPGLILVKCFLIAGAAAAVEGHFDDIAIVEA